MTIQLLRILTIIFTTLSIPSILLSLIPFFALINEGLLNGKIFSSDALNQTAIIIVIVLHAFWATISLIYCLWHFNKLGREPIQTKYLYGIASGLLILSILFISTIWNEIPEHNSLSHLILMFFIFGGGQWIVGWLLMFKLWHTKKTLNTSLT